MKTSQDFARAAQDIGALADRMKPPEGDPYAPGRNLAVCYLRLAAAQVRSVAEALAKKEQQE